jgi:hypothetical protein
VALDDVTPARERERDPQAVRVGCLPHPAILLGGLSARNPLLEPGP